MIFFSYFLPTNAVGHANSNLDSERMVLPLWRSLRSLNLMLPKEDRRAMLLRLYNEDTPLMDHSKDRFHDKSKSQPDADVKDEPDDIKNEEEEVDADVKDEMTAVKEEGDAMTTGLGEDRETMENGAVKGEGERDDDDVLSDGVKEEVEDGV